MPRLVYFSPSLNPKIHEKIVELLNGIARRHGIPWEEIVVWNASWYGKKVMMREEEVYERFLKPYTSIIKSSSEILKSMGLEVLPLPTSRKFRSRRGNVHVAGTIALAIGDVIVWASPLEQEVLQFLETLLIEGPQLIKRLVPDPLRILRKIQGHLRGMRVPEKDVLYDVAAELAIGGYEVFVNVKHNLFSGEDPEYAFLMPIL